MRVCYRDRHVVATQRPGMSARSSGNASAPFTAHSSVRRSLIAHAGRPAAHVGVLERDHERLGHHVRAALAHRPALPEAHHAVVGGHDLVHLRMVDVGHALHSKRE